MNYVTGALVVLLLLVVLIVGFQNWGSVDVKFLFWSFNAPKMLLILGTYVLGMFTGWGLLGLAKKAL
jgi:uncharacterized integral membrane protein